MLTQSTAMRGTQKSLNEPKKLTHVYSLFQMNQCKLRD